MNRKYVYIFSAVLLLLSLLAIQPGPAAAASVAPIFVADNPTCESLGYDFGYKIDPPAPGTYNFPGGSVTVTTDGVYFSWTSTIGIDAVIAKGGPNAHVYVYDPPAESFGDTNLHSPINDNNGQPFGLSHISFCYDLNVVVTKTATTTFTRTYQWDIDKSVTPAAWDLFRGDSGTSQYTIDVTRTGFVDSDWAVSGTIAVYNPAPIAAFITDVSDVISGLGPITPQCGVTFPYELAAGGTLNCTYSSPLPDGSSRTNTATVTTSGKVGGGQHTVPITFGAPTTEVHASVNVDDTNGGTWLFADTGSVSYSQTFTCDASEGSHENTATIRETGQFDDASVTVNCYALSVTKDAGTRYDRKYTWDIEKTGDQTFLRLSLGQQFLVNYDVVVSAVYADNNYAVAGKIWVNNPAPIAAVLNSVTDVVSPAIAATVDCGVTFPYTLAASDTLECTYVAALPDDAARTNTATATLQNYAYDKDLNPTPIGTTNFSGTAGVDFLSAVVTEIDECIDVTDDQYGALGKVCYSDLPKTFKYSMYVGPYAVCDDYQFINVASFVTNDTAATGSDNHVVDVTVPCPGCTLTPGYWKTHSKYGPAPYDETWALLGEDTLFYLSGASYYQVLGTPPAGNPYYILARAYIAARLNQLNEADVTAIADILEKADDFFAMYSPTDKLTKETRAAILGWATILDNYNNGYIGPGHCSE